MHPSRIGDGGLDLPPWLIGLSALFLGLAVATGILAPWQPREFTGACVPAQAVDALGPRVWENHRTVTVRRGTIVTVELWTGAPGEGQGWPWQPPVSSNQAVLVPMDLCPDSPNFTTVPLTLTPFKAVIPGRATITAPVLPNQPSDFQTFTLTVIVTP